MSEWRSLLEEAGLHDALRIEIQQQIDHIAWLLGTAEKFGYEPVVQQSRTLFGMGFSVVKVTGNMAKVATAVGTLFQFITHISVRDYSQAMNALAGLTSSASEVFAIASEQEQKALDAKNPKAITAGKKSRKRGPRKAIKEAPAPRAGGSKPDDYIDAEVVDDPPDSPAPTDGTQG